MLDTSIRKYSFGDATFITEMAGTMTLHNGSGSKPAAGAPYSANLKGSLDAFPANLGTIYGDVNGDGVEDAIVELDITQQQGANTEFSVWLGSKSGNARQLGKPFLTYGRCSIGVDSITINRQGIITLHGRGMGVSCSEAGEGAPYTATYKVQNNQVVALTPAPES